MAFRRTLTITGLVCCLFMLGLVPVAAGPPEPVGDQINLISGTPTAFAPDTPFHLEHGWLYGIEDFKGAGLYGFELWLDDSLVPASYKDVNVSADGLMSMARTVVFNFPDGLAAGLHEFIGVWLAPCKFAVDNGTYPGPCETPSEQVPVIELTLTVTFG